MTARVKRGSTLVQTLDGFPLQIADNFNRLSGVSALKSSSGNGYTLFLNSATGRAYTQSVGTTGSTSLITDGALVADKKIAAGTFGAVSVRDSTVFFFTGTQSLNRNAGSPITTPPMIDTLAQTVTVGTKDGKAVRLSLQGTTLEVISSTTVSAQPIVSLAGSLVVARDKAVLGSTTWTFGSLKVKAAVATGKASGWVGAALTETAEALLFYSDGTMKTVRVSATDSISTAPVIAEIEHRGGLVLLVSAGNTLYGYNEQGALVTNFPINAGSQITGCPIVTDIDGDTFEEILVTTAAGKLIAFNRFGEKLFSLAVAKNTESSPTVVPVPNGDGLYLFSIDRAGLLQGYHLPKASKNVQWSSLYSGSLNRNSYNPETSANRTPVTFTDMMPEKSVYNWPNPAREETRFRFYLTKPASVTIKVFDLTGVKVWEKSVQASANLDNEVPWTLSNVQSGIYYGVVTAKANGKSQVVKLKIAIAK
ncbi:MAG: T9SS type A sorting domain-containing protein [Chlorobiales bacterium]|nr:T9SS type A sorting domain-containing protein [Chlorobiales bacterium]